MFNIEFNLEGYDKLLSKLDGGELGALLDEIEKVVEETQLRVFLESQHLVPVDTGLLKNSGTAHLIERDSNGIEGKISYNTFYALWVHEILAYQHRDPTQAKYLEQPMENAEARYRKDLRQALDDYFGGA